MIWPFKREEKQREKRQDQGGAYDVRRDSSDTRSGELADLLIQGRRRLLNSVLEHGRGRSPQPRYQTGFPPDHPGYARLRRARAGEVWRSPCLRLTLGAVKSRFLRLGHGTFEATQIRRVGFTAWTLSGLQVPVRFSCLALRSCTSVMGVIRLGPGPGYLRLDSRI